jgi:hypothetical protein
VESQSYKMPQVHLIHLPRSTIPRKKGAMREKAFGPNISRNRAPRGQMAKAKLAGFDRLGLLRLIQDLYAAHKGNQMR